MTEALVGDPDRTGERGPADHKIRVQILEAADAHFRRYGFHKTTVADLGKAIGVSPAYIYKFYDSKQAIGEAICSMTLGRILSAVESVAAEPRSASERLRRIYKTFVAQGLEIYFNERKLHEIVTVSVQSNWASIATYREGIGRIVRRLLLEGRAAGEFERKTPLDDACGAIECTLAPFCHPILLEQTPREELEFSAEQVANLVLRSLAP